MDFKAILQAQAHLEWVYVQIIFVDIYDFGN